MVTMGVYVLGYGAVLGKVKRDILKQLIKAATEGVLLLSGEST